MMGLTPKMLECLRLIEHGILVKGYAPSCAEIKDALGLQSVGAAIRLLERLEDRGHIRRIKGKARAIELLNHPSPTICCPNCNHEFEPAASHPRRGETPDIEQQAPLAAGVRGEILEGAA